MGVRTASCHDIKTRSIPLQLGCTVPKSDHAALEYELKFDLKDLSSAPATLQLLIAPLSVSKLDFSTLHPWLGSVLFALVGTTALGPYVQVEMHP